MPIELPIVLPIACYSVWACRVIQSGAAPIGFRRPRVLGRTGLAWGAKGPGPDRLGLGGQGSWAGPAWLWLGGPRVLGQAGLAFIFRLDTAIIFRLDTAFCFRLDTASIFRLDTAIIFRLATAIIFRLDTAIICRLDAAIIFRLDTAIIFRLATAFIVYTQKNLLCIHKRSLVHAQQSCACSGPVNPGAGDPKRQRSRAWDRPSCLFGSQA